MKTYIQRIINDTITKLNYPAVDFSVEQPKDEKFGDYSANIAMMLARPLKSNPRKIAQEISDNLIYDKDNFEKIEIAGAGFLNFYFSKKYFQTRDKTCYQSNNRKFDCRKCQPNVDDNK